MAVQRYISEEALRESEARLDRAQEIAGVGSWELAIASSEFIWSRQLYRIAGLSPDAKPTIATMAASVHPDDYPAVPAWLAALQTGPRNDPIELRIKRPDGDERIVRLDGRPLIDADGAVRRLAGTAQDITERRLYRAPTRAGAEDGGDRQSDRRHGTRFQQRAGRHHRQPGSAEAVGHSRRRSGGSVRRSAGRGVPLRRSDPPAAGLRPPTVVASGTDRRECAGQQHHPACLAAPSARTSR